MWKAFSGASAPCPRCCPCLRPVFQLCGGCLEFKYQSWTILTNAICRTPPSFSVILGYLTFLVQHCLVPHEHYLWVKPPGLFQLPRNFSRQPYRKPSGWVPACFNGAWEYRQSNSSNGLGPASLLYYYTVAVTGCKIIIYLKQLDTAWA